MTRPEVTWGEPQNMPTDIELEPVTGKALQEFGRYQSVVYNLPKMISLLVEPWYSLVGEREQALGLMRAIICQLTFSHGPDHMQMIVVSSDLEEWDWVKWLPHFGDPRRTAGGEGPPERKPNFSLAVGLSHPGTPVRRRRPRRRIP